MRIIELIVVIVLISLILLIKLPKQFIIDNVMYIQILMLIIFVITCVINVINFKYGQEDRIKMTGINYSNLTQNKIHEIDKLFMMNPFLDDLYLEMYKDDPTIKEINKYKNESYDNYKCLKAEHHASNLIFQTISDIYTCNLCEENEWKNTFKNWLKSPKLRKHWKYLQFEYNNNVVSFINNLISS